MCSFHTTLIVILAMFTGPLVCLTSSVSDWNTQPSSLLVKEAKEIQGEPTLVEPKPVVPIRH